MRFFVFIVLFLISASSYAQKDSLTVPKWLLKGTVQYFSGRFACFGLEKISATGRSSLEFQVGGTFYEYSYEDWVVTKYRVQGAKADLEYKFFLKPLSVIQKGRNTYISSFYTSGILSYKYIWEKEIATDLWHSNYNGDGLSQFIHRYQGSICIGYLRTIMRVLYLDIFAGVGYREQQTDYTYNNFYYWYRRFDLFYHNPPNGFFPHIGFELGIKLK